MFFQDAFLKIFSQNSIKKIATSKKIDMNQLYQKSKKALVELVLNSNKAGIADNHEPSGALIPIPKRSSSVPRIFRQITHSI